MGTHKVVVVRGSRKGAHQLGYIDQERNGNERKGRLYSEARRVKWCVAAHLAGENIPIGCSGYGCNYDGG